MVERDRGKKGREKMNKVFRKGKGERMVKRVNKNTKGGYENCIKRCK